MELTRFEKHTLCSLIVDEQNRVEKRLRKLHEAAADGKKTIYFVGEGREDIDSMWRRETKTMDALNSIYKKFACAPNPDRIISKDTMEGWEHE